MSMLTRTAVVALFAGAGLTGCIDTDFEPKWKLQDWRVLTMVVDPPSFRPGEQVTFTPMVVNPTGGTEIPTGTLTPTAGGGFRCDGGTCFLLTLCLRPDRTPGLSGIQFDPEVPSQGCGDALGFVGVPEAIASETDPFVVRPDGSAVLDSSFVEGFLADATLEMTAAQLGLPEELVDRALREVGLTVTVEIRVLEEIDGNQVQHRVAFKRALARADGCVPAAETPCPGQNPPEPEFSIRLREDAENDASWVSARHVDSSFACQFCDRQDDGTCLPNNRELVLLPNREYILDPIDVSLDPNDPESWIEEYTVLDITGDFVRATEGAFYTWYATDGNIDRHGTNAPADEEIWTTPEEPGAYPIWMVVRDGQGGTSACRLDLRVGG